MKPLKYFLTGLYVDSASPIDSVNDEPVDIWFPAFVLVACIDVYALGQRWVFLLKFKSILYSNRGLSHVHLIS